LCTSFFAGDACLNICSTCNQQVIGSSPIIGLKNLWEQVPKKLPEADIQGFRFPLFFFPLFFFSPMTGKLKLAATPSTRMIPAAGRAKVST